MSHPLNELKMKAETMAVITITLTRRPSWAPRLQPGDELIALMRELGWLTDEDPPVARLWGNFTNPRRGQVQCEGFELRAGAKRSGQKFWYARYYDKSKVLTTIERFGANSDIPEKWEQARQQTAGLTGGWSLGPHWCPDPRPYSVGGQKWNSERLPKYQRATQLANTRILDFCGATEEQMRSAGSYFGFCCCCGRTLTDRISLEYGIGPECRARLGLAVQQMPGGWIIGGHNAAELEENDSCETLKPEEEPCKTMQQE